LERDKTMQGLADNSFAYLTITRIETTADSYHVTTYPLEKAVPWPLDVRATPLGYPNGIPKKLPNGQKFPWRWKRQIEKELPPLPMGNSEDYKEGEVAEKVYFHLKTDKGESWLSINPSEGIFNNGSTKPQLVLWHKNFPVPRYHKYYTPLNLVFYAKTSRENFFINFVEIHNLNLTLESTDKKNLYCFDDRLHYFHDIIKIPLVIKTTTLAENSYFRNKFNCDHAFAIELHLCHGYADLLDIKRFGEIDIQFEAVYINQVGVRTRRTQGFKLGAIITENVETPILDKNGTPMKIPKKKRMDLQPYSASEISIEV